jgi:hypothetical protein
MQIIQGENVPLKRELEHRGGMYHSRRLAEGEPGTVDNFQLTWGRMGGDFYSPRHRHNFEQIRVQLQGVLDYGNTGKLTPGMVGYFPEGVLYGPQEPTPDEQSITLVFQCGGASGGGYLSRQESKAAIDALSEIGVFDGGVFRRHDGEEGKRNMDGFQAIWEKVNQCKLEFPKPRYDHPIFMDPDNYRWLPVDGAPGVERKLLGVFSECRTEAGLLKLDQGAVFQAIGRGIYYILSGTGDIDGEPFGELTTLFVDHEESANFTAVEITEIVHFGLPDLRALRAKQDIAAE